MKKKRALAILLAVSLLPSTLAGCGKKEEPAAVEEETQRNLSIRNLIFTQMMRA